MEIRRDRFSVSCFISEVSCWLILETAGGVDTSSILSASSAICSIICEADIVPYEVVNVRVNSAYLMWKDTRCSQYNSQYSKVLFHAHQIKGHAGCCSSTVED